MTIALDTTLQEASKKTSRSRASWFMMVGFLIYTILILAGHVAGFPLAYMYLQTVCSDGCSLTPENVQALERYGLSVAFYANLYMAVQMIYILVCLGIALLIVFKKPGQWVPLGVSCFLLMLSFYEGANYPALTGAYPALTMPVEFLLALGGGLGTYAILTFPNGKFGSPWILGYFLVSIVEGALAIFIKTPLFIVINTVFGLASFPIWLGILIYRAHRLLNARERAAIKWIIVGWSAFIMMAVLLGLVVPALVPDDSLALLFVNFAGFFGCGVNIAGFLMAVLYANAFDIDVFVRRTLLYTLLTAILALVYAVLVLGSQLVLSAVGPEEAHSPVILVVSTLVIAALFQPLRRCIQALIDRRFYRHRYDAGQTLAAFSATIQQEMDVDQMREKIMAVVQETMRPTHVSLWLRQPESASRPEKIWNRTPLVTPSHIDKEKLA